MYFPTCLITSKGLAGSSRWFTSTCRLARMSTGTTPTESSSVIPPPKTHNNNNNNTCPWLMLPPSGSINYNFYSLADNRVIARHQTEKGFTIHDNLKVCGSSHGWLALLNPNTLDMFLYNPISHHHINLPPICDNEVVTKVILSCSPDEDEQNCRAVMIIHNRIGSLAFCCPGRSQEWTPLRPDGTISDIAYSKRQNLFFGLDRDMFLQPWDLSLLSSPRTTKSKPPPVDTTSYDDLTEDEKYDYYFKDSMDGRPKYLVVADEFSSREADDLLLVSRCLVSRDDEEDAPGRYLIFDDEDVDSDVRHPDMTIWLDVDAYDQEKGRFKEGLVKSLGDFAFFVGSRSDSVAMSATRLIPEVKPNSIYFPDAFEPEFLCSDTMLLRGHDFGVLDLENKTVSPCSYPCDDDQSLKGVDSSTLWFFPRGSV